MFQNLRTPLYLANINNSWCFLRVLDSILALTTNVNRIEILYPLQYPGLTPVVVLLCVGTQEMVKYNAIGYTYKR